MRGKAVPSRDLSAMHKDVVKTDICLDLQNNDLSNFGGKLYVDGNKLVEKRQLVFLRSMAVGQSDTSNLTNLMNLPFLRTETMETFERLVEVPGLGKWRMMFQKFLESLLRMKDLPTLFAKFSVNSFVIGVPFVPHGMTPVQFLASSTFPALFGYCWTAEFQWSYARFLADIVRNLKCKVPEFRKHWVFECYRAYILSSNMRKYMQAVFGPTLESLLSLCRAPNFAFSQSLIEEVICTIDEIIHSLIKHLPTMPRDVRFFLKSLFEAFENEDDGIDIVESVFLDCVLLPVYKNPKLFGILSDTWQMPPCEPLMIIGKMWSQIRHRDVKQPELDQFNYSRLHNLDFTSVLKAIIDVDETLNAPSLLLWMELCELNNVMLLLSVADISLLAFMITSTGLGGGSILEMAKSILEISNRVDFRVFHHESYMLGLYGISAPVPLAKWNRNALFEHNESARLFYKLLSVAPELPNEPSDVDEFLKFIESMSKLNRNYMTKSILSDLVNELKASGSEKSAILQQIFEEIKERKTHIVRNYERIVVAKEIQEQIEALDKQSDTRIEEIYSLIRGHIILSFFDNREDIKSLVEDCKQRLSKQRHLFRAFFEKCCVELEKFVTPIAPYLFQTSFLHLHSHLLKDLSLNEFVMAHPRFVEYDHLFLDDNSMRILEICGPIQYFPEEYLFGAASRELKRARTVELPVEAVKCLVRSIKALKDSMQFVGVSDEKINILFLQVLLTTPINQIYSFSRYLEFFVAELTYKGTPLLSDEENRIAMFVIELLSVCDRLLLDHFTLLPQL